MSVPLLQKASREASILFLVAFNSIFLKTFSAQEEESLEAVVVEKQQPRRPRRSVKKDATHGE